MSKKVVIGGTLPSTPQGTVWTAVGERKSDDNHIYINFEGDYRTHSTMLKTDLYIFSGCIEHDILSKFLTESKIEYIENYIDKLIISRLSPDEILDIIDDNCEKAFNEGYKKAQSNIKNALGFKD